MNKVKGKLVVFFENPFWVGVFERECEGKLSACKVTFGAKPQDYDLRKFIFENYDKLQFSSSVISAIDVREHVNPKRLQRQVKKEMATATIGTKSQKALKLQQEERKRLRKKRSKEQREAEKDRQFKLRQQKRREKHKGR